MPFLAIPITIGGVALGTVGTWMTIAFTVVSLVMARKAMKQPNIENNRKNLTTLRGATNPKMIPYGHCRMGGTMVFADTCNVRSDWDDTGMSDLFMAIAISPYRIHSFQNLFVNDKDLYWYEENSLSASWATKSNDSVTLYLHRVPSASTIISGTINGTAVPGGTTLCNFESYLNGLGYSVSYHSDSFIKASNEITCTGNESSVRALHIEETLLGVVWRSDVEGMLQDDGGFPPTYFFPVWDGTSKTYSTFSTQEVSLFVQDEYSGEWQYLEETGLAEFLEVDVHHNRPEWVDDDGLWYYPVWNAGSETYSTSSRALDPRKAQGITSDPFHFTAFSTTDSGETISTSVGATHGILQYEMNRGERKQQASVMLREHFPDKWTADHRGNGVANIVTHVFYDLEQLPNGIPNYSVHLMGRNDLIDPRDIGPGEDTSDIQALRDKIGRYTNNGVIVLMDYMLSPEGLNCTLDEIDLDNFAAEATIAEEVIYLKTADTGTIIEQIDNAIEGRSTSITVTGHEYTSFNYVKITYNSVVYYAEMSVIDEDTILAHFATPALTGSESVTIQLCQFRYEINGTIDTSIEPSGVIDSLLTHLGYGSLTFDNGKYKVKTGHYTTPVATLDEDWIIKDVVVRPRHSRDTLFNGVKGTYISRYKQWEVTDFPAYDNPTYCQEDNQGVACTVNDYIHQEVQYPFCMEPVRAKRLAKLYLEKHRQAEQLDLTCNLKAYKLDVGDIIEVNIDDLGFASKEFEVIKWTLNTDASISLSLKETASTVYDYAYGDYTNEDLAVNTQLPTMAWANQFDSVNLSTAAYFDTAGQLKEQIIVEVVMDAAYDYVFRATTQVQYRDLLLASDEWHNAYEGESLTCVIDNVRMSHYAVRVRGNHPLATPTDWYYEDIQTQGAGSLVTIVGMPKPVDPKCYFSISDNKIDRMRFRCEAGDISEWENKAGPEFFIFMYAMEEHPNLVNITDNNLTIAGADVIEEGSTPVLAGDNTQSKVRIWPSTNPSEPGADIAGLWWVRIYDASTTSYSKFVKIDWYDSEYIYLAREIEFIPTSSDTLYYYEMAFGDVRTDEFQLGIIQDGLSHEIILWDDLQYNAGTFSFLNVTRQSEDTSALDATGKEFSYCPAPGPGTALVVVPASAFNVVSAGIEASYEVDIKIPDNMTWASITCMFGRMTIDEGMPVLVRSPIVPLVYKGEL